MAAESTFSNRRGAAGQATSPESGHGRQADPARLAFDDVSHRYRTTPVLDHVSFTVKPGEIVCLLGPSGCGKTTLLRIASGVEQQSAGRVFLDGREVAGPSGFVPAEERGLGLVFQDYALFPHLTVMDNVLFGTDRRGRSAAIGRARDMLERMGLARYERVYPNVLSGGEQQRVALVRALMPRPRVLLMDEPFSGLDRTLRDQVRTDALALLRDTSATAMIVTHDPEEAMLIGDRIVLLRAGRVIQFGAPEALYRRPADLDAARFFSELNEMTAEVANGAAVTPLGRVPVPGLADGTEVVVAVRPQGLQLSGLHGDGAAAQVVGRRFLGESERLDLSVDGLIRPLVCRLPAGTAPEGDRLRVSVTPGAALLFPQPAAQAHAPGARRTAAG